MEVNEEGNEEIMNSRKLDVLSHIITLIFHYNYSHGWPSEIFRSAGHNNYDIQQYTGSCIDIVFISFCV